MTGPARARLLEVYARAVEALTAAGYGDAVKAPRRDHREPGKREKEEAEDALAMLMLRIFRKQAARVREQLERRHPERAVKADIDDWFTFPDFDDDDMAELVELLIEATRGGVNLFGQQIPIGINYSLVNSRAAQWAREYAYDLVRGINETTRQTLRQAISAFVETPGFTLADTMDMLPFDEQRAQNVATTEITRAYSQADSLAAAELAKEFPDVEVIETWFTNADELVCDLCVPLDGKEIKYGETFYEPDAHNDGKPPRHSRCRCWKQSSTRITD